VLFAELNPDLDNSGLLARFSEVDNPQVKQAVDELKLLFKYAEVLGCSPSTLVFEPSLARGLDYYTGAIYEVILTGG
jgi:histidyl-tRNA synthetase